MKILKKPPKIECFCDKCETVFILGKKDWRCVKTQRAVESVYDAEHNLRKTRYYHEHFTKCPVCKNETRVYRRRIDND